MVWQSGSLAMSVVVVTALLLATTAAQPQPQPSPEDGTIIHVAATAPKLSIPPSLGDGSFANPFQSLQEAKEHIIRLHRTVCGRVGRRCISAVRRVLIQQGQYLPIAIDHPALSGIEWRGAGTNATIVSGGIEIPRRRFKQWPAVPGAFVASIAGLGADDLGAMVSGNEVSDCQNDKVSLSYGDTAMVNARWPNKRAGAVPDQWRWARAMNGCEGGHSFTMNISKDLNGAQFDKWTAEQDPFMHGYWEWDWGDTYAPLSDWKHRGDTIELAYRDGHFMIHGT